MQIYWLMLGVLAVWRVTHLLNAEDGPGDLLVRLRRAAGNGFGGKLLDCFHCLSLWVSAPMAWAIGETWSETVFLWLGLSGGAILLQTMVRKQEVLPAQYFEDKENDYVMLRKSEEPVSSGQPGTSGP